MPEETQNMLIYIGLTLAVGLVFLIILLRGLTAWGTRLNMPAIALNPLRFVIKWAGTFIVFQAFLVIYVFIPAGVVIGFFYPPGRCVG